MVIEPIHVSAMSGQVHLPLSYEAIHDRQVNYEF